MQSPFSPREPYHFAAGAKTIGNRTPQIDARAAAPYPTPRPPLTGSPLEPGKRPDSICNLIGRQRGKILIGTTAALAPRLERHFYRRVSGRVIGSGWCGFVQEKYFFNGAACVRRFAR